MEVSCMNTHVELLEMLAVYLGNDLSCLGEPLDLHDKFAFGDLYEAL